MNVGERRRRIWYAREWGRAQPYPARVPWNSRQNRPFKRCLSFCWLASKRGWLYTEGIEYTCGCDLVLYNLARYPHNRQSSLIVMTPHRNNRYTRNRAIYFLFFTTIFKALYFWGAFTPFFCGTQTWKGRQGSALLTTVMVLGCYFRSSTFLFRFFFNYELLLRLLFLVSLHK